MDSYLEEWEELEKEYLQLEVEHRDYYRKVEEVKAVQKKCMSNIAHQRYRVKQIQAGVARCEKMGSDEEKAKLVAFNKKLVDRKIQFRELEEVLPHENGIYLKVILGSVNVSLLSKQDKYNYKEDYERFKLYVTIVTLVLGSALLFLHLRVTDAAFQFLLVWYYCTLTIREHILKVNGSRIKGWWISHHFISTLCAGVILIWPDGYTYNEFRPQFVAFSLYLGVLQLMQYYYQSGSLYRLRALGERRNMDITVEGFQSWMWKGLTFLLPFLLGGYIFQLMNSIVLFQLARHERCKEWQVWVLSVIFFVLFLGNFWTTGLVIKQKLQKRLKQMEFTLINKYRFHKTNQL